MRRPPIKAQQRPSLPRRAVLHAVPFVTLRYNSKDLAGFQEAHRRGKPRKSQLGDVWLGPKYSLELGKQPTEPSMPGLR